MNTIFGNFPEKIIPNLKDAIIKFTLSGKDSEMNLEDLATNLGAGVTSIIPGSGISVDQSTGNVTISATGGGGGTNPTSTYVPYNNEGIFADSYLINDPENYVLKTYSGHDKGLYFDFVNNSYTLGDYAGSNYNTKFIIDDNNQIIKTSNTEKDKGLLIDFAGQQYVLGNPEGESWGNANNSDGLMINFTSEIISLGYNFSGGVTLYMDNSNQFIRTSNDNVGDKGLELKFGSDEYYFGASSSNGAGGVYVNGENRTVKIGDSTGNGDNTFLQIDDYNQKLILSENLVTGTEPSESSGKWLKVTIGTTDYLIALLNPTV